MNRDQAALDSIRHYIDDVSNISHDELMFECDTLQELIDYNTKLEDKLNKLNNLYSNKSNRLTYIKQLEKALHNACEMLLGGTADLQDGPMFFDDIFSEIMEKDGCVSGSDISDYLIKESEIK